MDGHNRHICSNTTCAPASSLYTGIWWGDVTGGQEAAPLEGQPAGPRRIRRVLPSFSYLARSAPLDTAPEYAPAIVASFPLSRLVVIRDLEGGTYQTALERDG
ncbi:MAG: hypothetical protein M1296_04765 [Chloroflexi bacterium]|nr:hypothetical protein [Chloroflexota bacterium]